MQPPRTFRVPWAWVKQWSRELEGRQMAEITCSTLIMTANKKCNLPFGLWQAVSK